MWQNGILTVDNPKGLFNAVFFLNGKFFRLRGGQEHRSLRISQLSRHTDPLRYEYTENAATDQVGRQQNRLRVNSKAVKLLADPEAGTKCHVYVLDLYLSKLPPQAFTDDNFYVKPVSVLPEDRKLPWFLSVPVGINSLAKIVKDLSRDDAAL